MIKIENVEVAGWEPAIRGMRNPMNSWEKSDSMFNIHETTEKNIRCFDIFGEQHFVSPDYFPDDWYLNHADEDYYIGPNDLDLMKRLVAGGTEHRKFMRMIAVWCDITAPLYLLKEMDTFKVGTVANSCSTMHKIHTKEFELDDFSHEHLLKSSDEKMIFIVSPHNCLMETIATLNDCRKLYLETKDKKYWWQMIQLLPSSYNQRRTYMFNYEVLSNIYRQRKNHKLDEWRDLCSWIETLPYAKELIVSEE